MIIPGASAAAAPMVVEGGKDGTTYVLNSHNLGGYNPSDSVVQEWSTAYGHWGGNVYYNNMLYLWSVQDVLRLYSFNGSKFSPFASGAYHVSPAFANGPAMSLSANGVKRGTAILWVAHSQSGADNGNYPALLHAYDATTGKELWNSGDVAADYPGAWSKWTPPTIADGKVFLATFDSGVAVYGLLPVK